MQGKESIAINLKDERGKKIMHQLVAEADVFMHSFRPGVPESLGIDETTLRAINPGLVYQYAASYGSVGPYSRQPAIDPVIAAFSGATAYQAGEGNDPLRESGADPVAAAGHATATMLAVFAKHRTGQGQSLESAMVQSNLYLNCRDAFSYDGKPALPELDHLQLGTGATHRLYETAPAPAGSVTDASLNPNPHWVMFAAVDDDSFGRFCKVAGRDDLAADARYATAAARTEHRKELEAELEGVFRTRGAREWETSLLDAEVGCVVADAMSHFAYLYRDPQAAAIGAVVKSEHPSIGGVYFRYAPILQFSDTPSQVVPFSEKGEYTWRLLAEVGYDEVAITRLMNDGVVTWPGAEPEAKSPTS
jgi:crotonobetainyl-CoA:carnitine CoA-transferase CaiB-like acyl-CoA transferase